MLSPDIVIRTRPTSRTNHLRNGTWNPIASLRESEKAKYLIEQYDKRVEAECVSEDDIARRAAAGLRFKEALAARPIPKHRALVPVGRVKRRRAKR